MSDLPEQLVREFERSFGDAAGVVVAMAPGRVNLIGEYTDFNDGFVLPMTVDRGVYLALRRRDDWRVRIRSIRYNQIVDYDLRKFRAPTPGVWSSYVLGVVEEMRLRGLVGQGFEAVIDGDLNLGAGLSSSAALEVATAISLQQVMGFDMHPVDMAKLCQHVEHSYANVLCGIMDQFASRLGRRAHALLLDCRSLEYRDVPLSVGDYRVVIVSSEVKRSLASSAYNTRRGECQAGVEHFRRVVPEVRALRDVDLGMFEAEKDDLTPVVRRRCRHVIAENQRTLDAADALESGRLEDLGALMIASHASLRDDFEVSCPELDFLVEVAIGTPGVLGARMTGAGFGGCTVSLVHADALDALAQRLQADYAARFGLVPGIFLLNTNLEAGPVAE